MRISDWSSDVCSSDLGRQAHRITLDIGDEADGDVMMLRALAVRPLRAVGLGQLDPVTVQVIDGADMDTVRADHVHMFPDAAGIDPRDPHPLRSWIKRAAPRLDALPAGWGMPTRAGKGGTGGREEFGMYVNVGGS